MARGQASSTSKRKRNDTGVIGDTTDPMTKESLLKFYRDMLLIRPFEERAGQLYGMGLIGGFCHLYKRGASFRIPGEEVDGMDVMAVQAAARKAADHARSGNGPYILEMKTYRYRGHSMSDPAKYRTREEVDEVRKTRDPIDHLQELLEKKGWADEAALKAIDAEVKKIVADAAEFARTSPEPDPRELYTDVYLEASV